MENFVWCHFYELFVVSQNVLLYQLQNQHMVCGLQCLAIKRFSATKSVCVLWPGGQDILTVIIQLKLVFRWKNRVNLSIKLVCHKKGAWPSTKTRLVFLWRTRVGSTRRETVKDPTRSTSLSAAWCGTSQYDESRFYVKICRTQVHHASVVRSEHLPLRSPARSEAGQVPGRRALAWGERAALASVLSTTAAFAFDVLLSLLLWTGVKIKCKGFVYQSSTKSDFRDAGFERDASFNAPSVTRSTTGPFAQISSLAKMNCPLLIAANNKIQNVRHRFLNLFWST